MKYIIWGTGNYCQNKIDYLSDIKIVAFVERERTVFRGVQTILPCEINEFDYDKIIVMSNYYLEIIQDIINLGISASKIIPGIVCKPYLANELDFMSSNVSIDVNSDGTLLYRFNKTETVISAYEDWKCIRRIACNEDNSNIIKQLNFNPVGRTFGLNRGGSICRYYIDKFLDDNSVHISGNVLEIGDRQYSNRYSKQIDKSDCLHFDKSYKNTSSDFYGDLRTGIGIKKDYYDCIILTQVLNFVEDINQTAKILINSLKVGGKILITVSGITPVSRFDMDRWGHFRNFTDKGLQALFVNTNTKCNVQTYGNFKVACAFLGGMSYTELSEKDLGYNDDDFQTIIVAVVTKK